MRFSVVVTMGAFAVLYNIWVLIFPDPDPFKQSQALWAGGFCAGTAFALVVAWINYFRDIDPVRARLFR